MSFGQSPEDVESTIADAMRIMREIMEAKDDRIQQLIKENADLGRELEEARKEIDDLEFRLADPEE